MVQMQQSSGHRPMELQQPQPHQQVTDNLSFFLAPGGWYWMTLPNFLTSRTLERGSQLLLEQPIVLAQEILLGLLLHPLHPLILQVVEYQWQAILIFCKRVQWFAARMEPVDLPRPQTRWYDHVDALVSMLSIALVSMLSSSAALFVLKWVVLLAGQFG